MSTSYKLLIATVVAFATLCGCATDPTGSNSSVAQIRSAADLQTHLQTATSSPLDRLSPAAKQRFVSSLIFTEYGLGSFQYSALNELSATEIYQILSLFGVERAGSLFNKGSVFSNFQEELVEDHTDYLCEGIGTCRQASGYICTSNC